MNQIIGICLFRNEDLYADWVIKNIYEVCDHLILLDNNSSDNTAAICRKWTDKQKSIEFYSIKDPSESHSYINDYVNTNTWVFAVDGDEIYDSVRLKRFMQSIARGAFDEYTQIMGNVLNCDKIDIHAKKAYGYLARPCRSLKTSQPFRPSRFFKLFVL